MALLSRVEKITRLALRAGGFESLRHPTSLADVHVYEARSEGRLPPVVLLHGIGASATSFAPVMRRLRPRVSRLLAVDAPGHGFSGLPSEPVTPTNLFASVAEVIDRRMDEPFVVVGNSLGGAFALRYALERPERVLGVVACSPGGARMTAGELDELRRVFHLSTRAHARAFLERLYHRPPWFAPLLAPEVQSLLMSGTVRQFFEATSVDDLFTGDDLGELRAPALVLWGESDRLLPREHLAFFREHLPPHAVVEETERCGHSPHIERPRMIAERIARFAAGLSGG